MHWIRKFSGLLAFARGLDERFHMIQVFFEGAAAGGCQPELGLRHTAGKRLGAGDIARIFELAGMDAQVAVTRAEKFFELVERERRIHGKRADDCKPGAFVYQPVETCSAGFLLSRTRRISFCFFLPRNAEGALFSRHSSSQ